MGFADTLGPLQLPGLHLASGFGDRVLYRVYIGVYRDYMVVYRGIWKLYRVIQGVYRGSARVRVRGLRD